MMADNEALEVPYILPDGRPLSSLNQEEFQVFMYGFEAIEMQQVMTCSKQLKSMVEQLTVHRGKVKNDARKAKSVPVNYTMEQRQEVEDTLKGMYDNYNEAGALVAELKDTVFLKDSNGVKLPNILGMSKKVAAVVKG
jgi:hypothetical protein